MQVKDSVFVITGAGSGLGAETARWLVSAGAKVVIADVDARAGEAQAERLGKSIRFAKTDVTDAASAKGAIETAVNEFGGLNGLINCAGVAPPKKVVGRDGAHDLATFTRVVNINLNGTFNMIRLAAETMAKGQPNTDGERGVIVNTASIAAFDGQVGQAAYAASKAGVVGLTLPVARELAAHGIRVVTIAPGIFETPMLKGLPQAAQESLGNTVPFPSRLGRPSEYAALVQHIVENVYLNGEVIRLDGAIRMVQK